MYLQIMCLSRGSICLHLHSGALQGTQSQYFRMKSITPSARWKNCSSLSPILLKKGNSLDIPDHPAHISTIAIQQGTGSETWWLSYTLHPSSAHTQILSFCLSNACLVVCFSKWNIRPSMDNDIIPGNIWRHRINIMNLPGISSSPCHLHYNK